MCNRFGFAAAATVLVLAIFANSSSQAQAIAPSAPVNPPAAPATESAPLEPQVTIEPATGVAITWSVVNRFRLFRDERDFRRHVEAMQGHAVQEAEQALAAATDGGGWASEMLGRLCLDRIGQGADECMRGGGRGNYLNPADPRVEVLP